MASAGAEEHAQRKAFGARVRYLRKNQGYSQEGFAFEVGLDRTYIGGIERGERNVSLDNIYRIAGALKTPVGALFENSTPTEAPRQP